MGNCKHSWEVDRWPGPMVWIEKCAKCGAEKTMDRETGKEILRPLASTWFVSPIDVKNGRAYLGYTQQEMANVLCTSLSTYSKWEQGLGRIPGVVGAAIALLITRGD